MAKGLPRALGGCLALAVLASMAFFSSACGDRGESLSSWERDPIVPGYSIAEINIGDPFSAVLDMHGEPEQDLRNDGYHFAYYARTREKGRIDDPASWRVVVTLYDNGNGYLDVEDEVGAVEVSSPYYGTTSGGVGIGSTPAEIEEEFGPCESITATSGPGGEALQLYSYSGKGVDFLVSRAQGVVTVVVTAYGGLLPVEEENGDGDAQGGLFGIHEAAPVVPGQAAAGIAIGEEYRTVKEKYGAPDSTGFTTEGLVYATYTGGYGTWKLTLYLEDMDKNDVLGDFDLVVSINVRSPYAGKTPGGVGIGSPTADVVKEFGAPERQNSVRHQGEDLTIMEYNTIGIVFAARDPSGDVVEIDVNRPLAP